MKRHYLALTVLLLVAAFVTPAYAGPQDQARPASTGSVATSSAAPADPTPAAPASGATANRRRGPATSSASPA